MKKLLVLALCAACGLASAASIQWNMNLGRSGYIADANGDKMTGTLYFLLTDTANSLSDAVASDTFADTLSSVALGSMELTAGKNTTVNTATSSQLTADTTYSFSLLVFDTVNKQYYVSSALSEVAYDETADVVTPTKVTFDTSKVGSTFAASWKSTVPAVPEPSTAALALAGLAMLLKRRKA